LNTHASKGAALVLAANKPELKSVELSAYGCSSCGFHFSSNAGAEPFCPNCSSEAVTASVKPAAKIPASDKDMTSIHCSVCDTYNLVESATDKVFAGLAHCVCCGTSLVYDVNEGDNDPADTRPPAQEETVVEHADAQTDLNDGDAVPGSEPNQRAPDMQAGVTTEVAETAEQLNDGEAVPGSEPNQRAPEMDSNLSTEHANEQDVNDGQGPNAADTRPSRWEQADGLEDDFVEPLDGAPDAAEQQNVGEQQMANEQQQQQQQTHQQQQQQADVPNSPAEQLDLSDSFEQDACDGPMLEMSMASVVLSSVKTPELSLISHDGGVLAQVNGVQIATLSAEQAGDNAKVMHSRAFHSAVAAYSKQHGVRKALAHFKFAETQVKFPQTKTVAALVQTRVAEKASMYQESVSELNDNMAHSLQLAAAGLARGSFKGKDNVLMKTLASVLTTHGIKHADRVVQAAFVRSGDAYHETLLEVASSLLAKGHEYRNELADLLGETNAPDLGEVEDGAGTESLASRLETSGLKPSNTVVSTPETASAQVTSISEMRSRAGGRVF
jgi:DNA-directed RNA polymerase subunit RPC12/RpoP